MMLAAAIVSIAGAALVDAVLVGCRPAIVRFVLVGIIAAVYVAVAGFALDMWAPTWVVPSLLVAGVMLGNLFPLVYERAVARYGERARR